MYPVHPSFVGRDKPQIVMGKKSGLDNVWIWAESMGLELNNEEAMEVLQRVKIASHDSKRVLTENEFKEIVEKVKSES